MKFRINWPRFAVYSISCCLLLSCGGPRFYRDQDNQLRDKLVAAAASMQGKPYRYGGATPLGFDCSGLVVYTYKQFNIDVPRTSYKQYKSSRPVYQQDLQPGDLLFFRTDSSFVSHVGIYLGGKKFIHAPGKGDVVRVNSMNEEYYRKRFVGAGTYLQ